MTTGQEAEPEGAGEIRISVNDQPVVLRRHNVTGLEIKEAAIAVGVPIQLDFVLSEVLSNGEQRIIPDDRHLAIKTGDQFWAIPGDDNS